MDPFSITVGALGITEFALSSIDKLRGFINGLAEAKEVVQDIASSLEAVQRPLAALGELKFRDSEGYAAAKEDLNRAGVAEAVNQCGQACADFSKNLEQWTKHSSNTKLSLRDRLSVGLWNKEKIRTFRMRVQSCQAVVQFAIESAQLIIQLRSQSDADTNRKKVIEQVQALEKTIQEHIDIIKKQQDEVQKRGELFEEEPEDEEDGGAQRALAIQEVRKQSRLLETDQTASRVVSSQLRSSLPGQETSETHGSHNIIFSGDNNTGWQLGHNSGTINGVTFGKGS